MTPASGGPGWWSASCATLCSTLGTWTSTWSRYNLLVGNISTLIIIIIDIIIIVSLSSYLLLLVWSIVILTTLRMFIVMVIDVFLFVITIITHAVNCCTGSVLHMSGATNAMSLCNPCRGLESARSAAQGVSACKCGTGSALQALFCNPAVGGEKKTGLGLNWSFGQTQPPSSRDSCSCRPGDQPEYY